jgi:branched-chain amino acid transport system ATP-binding protein
VATILHIDDVTKSFGLVVAANGVTVKLEEGEALGVIGPNGAGKTTLFNLVSGLFRPSAGRIHLRGVDITDLAPSRRCRAGIGRTFQIPHPFSGMTVFENTLVGAAFGGGHREQECHERCIAILERVGLLNQANVLAGSLRLLDRKRLELARALASEPVLLLLDEIAGGLTEHETRELIDIIKEIRAGGVTIIWIEHVVHALLSVVDRLMAMNFGTILSDGHPATVMASAEVREIYMGIAVE